MKPIQDIIDKLVYREITPIKWYEIYDDEDELISDLKSIRLVERYPSAIKGFIYLSGYREKLLHGEPLTESQMKQLKCLASEVAYEKYIVEKSKMWAILK